MGPRVNVRVTFDKIDITHELTRTLNCIKELGNVGSIVTYIGVVKSKSKDGLNVKYLVIKGREDEIKEYLFKIANEEGKRFGGTRAISIVLRLGEIDVGDVILVIEALCERRYECIAVVDTLINRIKGEAPLSKYEIVQG